MYKQFSLLVAAQLILAGSAWTQQNAVQWGDATAEKLSRFLLKPAPGLIPHTPWGGQSDNQVSVSSGGTETQQYQDAVARQVWFFDDPELSQQVAKAQKERAELDRAHWEDVKSHAAERNALQKQALDLLKKGQTKESQALMVKIKAADAPYEAKKKELDDRVEDLKRHGRRLLVSILANFTPDTQFGGTPALKPAESLAGHPLYRRIGRGPEESVDLAVYLGPPGFRNPSARNPELKVKCILVRVEILSDAPHSETIKADEAVARQMLEKVDYAGLARLLEH